LLESLKTTLVVLGAEGYSSELSADMGYLCTAAPVAVDLASAQQCLRVLTVRVMSCCGEARFFWKTARILVLVLSVNESWSEE